MKLDLTSLMKSNLKWIKDVNVRPETIKLPQENIGRKLLDIGHVDDNLDMTLREQATKENQTNETHQNKKLCTAKEMTNKMKWQNVICQLYLNVCSGTQLCLTLCSPMDYILPGFPVQGIFQARILKWVAISDSRDLPDPVI